MFVCVRCAWERICAAQRVTCAVLPSSTSTLKTGPSKEQPPPAQSHVKRDEELQTSVLRGRSHTPRTREQREHNMFVLLNRETIIPIRTVRPNFCSAPERERESECKVRWEMKFGYVYLSLSHIWMWNGSLKYINFYNHGFLWKKMGVLLPRAVVRHGVFVHIISMLLNVPSRRSSRSELPRVCAHIERSATLASATRQQNST